MKQHFDYVIIGQGISGTVLAITLLENGKSVLVIDDPKLSNASHVAAGLYNPVVFKRLVKSWMADELIPFMDKFYTKAEKLLNERFYYKKQIIKVFADENEKAFWLKKSEEEVGKYLNKQLIDDPSIPVKAPFGMAEVLHAGNLNTTTFLNTAREFFRKEGMLLEEIFDHSLVDLHGPQPKYKDISASRMIFCEGYKASDNPFFKGLDFKLTKGEVLTVKLPQGVTIPEDMVINKGVFILPLQNDTYKVGATYEWNDLNESPTEKGRNELIEKLDKVITVHFEIIDHEAGIRPTVNDRRPILGVHPEHPGLAVFNGLGTKGVMLAPYFANQLIDHLEKGLPIDPQVQLSRFS